MLRLRFRLSLCEITHVRRDVVRDDAEFGVGQRESLERGPARLRVRERARRRVRAIQYALDADLSDARRDTL